MSNDIVFYSWQSDLPNSTNRGFIQTALEKAAKEIKEDNSIEVEPVIDRDTAGVAGSPDIPTTIFAKIEKASVFLCDVSIINRNSKFRKTTNPNVLVELGYAIKTLGLERVVMVMNTAFGKPELLPFDLNKKRVVIYCMPERSSNQAEKRKELKSKLRQAVQTILAKTQTKLPEETPVTKLKRYLVDDQYRIELDDLIRDETKKLFDYISQINSLPSVKENSDPSADLAKELERQTKSLRNIMIVGCYHGDKRHKQIWRKSLEQILNPIGTNLLELKRYPALILLYTGGIAAMMADKYYTLKSLLTETKYIDGQEKTQLVTHFSASELMNKQDAQNIFGQDHKMTPISNHLLELLRVPLTDIITGPPNYDEYFDRFEYLMALIRLHVARKTNTYYYIAHGRFVCKRLVQIHDVTTNLHGIVKDIEIEAKEAGNDWLPLKAGFFDSNISHFLAIKKEYDKGLEQIRNHLRFGG